MRTPPKRLLKRPARTFTAPKLGMALFDVKELEGSTTLLIVPRVGQLKGPLPSGYELSSCDRCGHATWVNSKFMAGFKSRSLAVRVECMTCTPI